MIELPEIPGNASAAKLAHRGNCGGMFAGYGTEGGAIIGACGGWSAETSCRARRIRRASATDTR